MLIKLFKKDLPIRIPKNQPQECRMGDIYILYSFIYFISI